MATLKRRFFFPINILLLLPDLNQEREIQICKILNYKGFLL